jgi:hypothetical protein
MLTPLSGEECTIIRTNLGTFCGDRYSCKVNWQFLHALLRKTFTNQVANGYTCQPLKFRQASVTK